MDSNRQNRHFKANSEAHHEQGKAVQVAAPPTKKVRLSFHSTNVKALEDFCSNFINTVKKNMIKVKGPRRMPVQRINITTRKSPCGQGTNTWDKFEIRTHKTVVDFFVNDEQLSNIRTFGVVDGNISVDINITPLKNVPVSAKAQ